MSEKRNTESSTVLGAILGISIGVIVVVFVIPFVFMVIIWGGEGKLDDEEKITAAVTENQEVFQDIATRLLEPEQNLDFWIDIKGKEFNGLGGSENIEFGTGLDGRYL